MSLISFVSGVCLSLCLTGMVEAQRIQVEVEGVYRGGENESFAEVMTKAREDAMRQAAEQLVGVYIRQRTVIETYRLKHQELVALTQALVRTEVLMPADSQRAHYHQTGGEGRIRMRAWVERIDLDRQVRALEEAGTQYGDLDAGMDSLGVVLNWMIGDLARRMGTRSDGRRWRVFIDQVNDARLHFPSSASGYVRDRLGIVAQDYWDLVLRDSEAFHLAQARIDSALSDTFDSSPSVEPGQFQGYDARLTGTYRVAGDQVLFHVKLVNPVTMRELALGHVDIPRRHLPEGLSLVPDLTIEIQHQIADIAAVPVGDAGLQIEVWPDRGDGATYREGDVFFVRFRASRDCYVRLFHIDPTGQIAYMYPRPPSEQKKVHAGVIYTIPEPGYGRRWKVGPPFGIDQIKAVVSTAPFQDAPQEAVIGTYHPGAMRGIIQRGLREEALSAEAFCTFRTQAR